MAILMEKEQLKQLWDKKSEVKHRKNNFCSKQAIFKKEYNICYENIKKTQEVVEITSLLDGTNKLLTNKMSFERFVLSSYLNDVLIQANEILSHLLNGQYQLVISKTTRQNALVGLDIDIYDSYSQEIRSAHTLSGGESFCASLALAIGLSDLIRKQNGGFQMGHLFIDEGFGSLDDENAQIVLTQLTKVLNDNRKIGIISHVDKLKQVIFPQLKVIKTRNGGSKIEIEE